MRILNVVSSGLRFLCVSQNPGCHVALGCGVEDPSVSVLSLVLLERQHRLEPGWQGHPSCLWRLSLTRKMALSASPTLGKPGLVEVFSFSSEGPKSAGRTTMGIELSLCHVSLKIRPNQKVISLEHWRWKMPGPISLCSPSPVVTVLLLGGCCMRW